MLSILLLPLLAAGVAGLRLGHEVVAHGASFDGSAHSGGCGGHGSCGSRRGSTREVDQESTPSTRTTSSTPNSPSSPGDGDCRDCDLLAASIGAASSTEDDAPGVMVVVAVPSREVDRFSIGSPEVERARPPPV